MKYKDYYAALGVERTATPDAIKAAYRKLARRYHPDVSKEKDAEEKFKEVAEAYETLKDPEKRAAYDQLGRHRPGDEFRPPPDWQQSFGDAQFSFDDLDLADLPGRAPARSPRRSALPQPGRGVLGWSRFGLVRDLGNPAGASATLSSRNPGPDVTSYLYDLPQSVVRARGR